MRSYRISSPSAPTSAGMVIGSIIRNCSARRPTKRRRSSSASGRLSRIDSRVAASDEQQRQRQHAQPLAAAEERSCNCRSVQPGPLAGVTLSATV